MLITLTAAVPLSTFILPPIHRWYMLEKLLSDEPAVREEGQKYLIGFASEKPEVLAGAIERLEFAEETPFRELVLTIDQIGFWDRDHIGNKPWLRWLDWIASDGDPQARLMAPQMLADAPDLALTDESISIVFKLADDSDSDVRYNTLVAAAEMVGIAKVQGNESATSRYIEALLKLTTDKNPTIARQAWMFCGLLKQIPEASEVEQNESAASIWARSDAASDTWTSRAVRLLNNTKSNPVDRAMAAQLLVQHDEKTAASLIALLDEGPTNVTVENQLTVWRTILGLTRAQSNTSARKSHADAVAKFLSKTTLLQYQKSSVLRPLILSAIYQAPLSDAVRQLDPAIRPDPLFILAAVEGGEFIGDANATSEHLHLEGEVPEMVRVAQLRTAKIDQKLIRLVMPLFLSESPEIRDLACVIAAQRMSTEQCASIVRALWRRPKAHDSPDQPIYIFSDRAKISGAILAGLSGVEPHALDRMAIDFSDRWLVRDMIHLAQWMQGRPPAGKDYAQYAANLLVRDDVPRSTILLTLLHRRPDIALDYLLTPRGDLNIELVELLEQYRWWHVLKHYLPANAPRVELWADPQLIAFQVDLLRNWYALNRYRISVNANQK